MTDVYIPAAAGTFAVVTSAHVDDYTAFLDRTIPQVTKVWGRCSVVAWRIPADTPTLAEPVLDIRVKNYFMVWLPERDGTFRSIAPADWAGWHAADLTEARQITWKRGCQNAWRNLGLDVRSQLRCEWMQKRKHRRDAFAEIIASIPLTDESSPTNT